MNFDISPKAVVNVEETACNIYIYFFKFNLYSGNEISVAETGFHFRPDIYNSAKRHHSYAIYP